MVGFDFDPEKNRHLKETRGVCFEDVIALMEDGKTSVLSRHPNQEKYPHQLICEVEIDGYMYVVPLVRQGEGYFLKTIYPSRKATKKRRQGE
jgi:uncharacterized DUF497 family protein